jgi:hypothetical protein
MVQYSFGFTTKTEWAFEVHSGKCHTHKVNAFKVDPLNHAHQRRQAIFQTLTLFLILNQSGNPDRHAPKAIVGSAHMALGHYRGDLHRQPQLVFRHQY